MDDAWIYLRYARNLIEGHGWVYNIGEPVNAATSQLNTLLLAGFGAMLGSLVVSQVIVFTLGSGGAAKELETVARIVGAALEKEIGLARAAVSNTG